MLEKYKSFIRRLFPIGWAWRIYDGSDFQKFVDSLAEEPCRIEERTLHFLEELDPNITFEMLDNWERLLRIPDECTPPNEEISISERRVRILQKLTTGGGQNAAFYLLIAQQLGYDVDVLDVENFAAFRVGISRVGKPLANTTGWAFTWVVKAPASFVKRFRVGQSTVGERLALLNNITLECVIKKFKPAHTTVLFSYFE